MNRNVVVTGGSKGIGRAIVDAFLNEGDRVIFTARNEAEADKVLREKKEEVASGRLFFFKGDVSAEEDVKALADFTVKQVGACDVLVNNAAIFRGGNVHLNSIDDFDTQFAINVRGVFLTSKYFVPQMLEKKAGSIINIASLAGLNGGYNMAIYSSTKAAVVGLTRSMAMDYMRYGVRVNGICPSATLTEMFLSGNDAATIKMYEDNNPARRLGQPKEIADAAVFLASDKASYIAGQMLSVDGGLAAWNGEACQPTR